LKDEKEKQFGNLSVDDLKRILNLVDECITLMQEFYKVGHFYT
jgi:hypothetical protein